MGYVRMLLTMLGAGAGFAYFNQRGIGDVTKLIAWIRSKLPSKKEKEEQVKLKRELEIELSLARAYRRELAEMVRQDVNVTGPWKRGWK